MMRGSFLRASLVLAALSATAGVAGAQQRIQMPLGYRLTWIGARWQADAKVVDRSGRPVAAALTYRMADPSIATVTARGEVTARKPGNTKLWAVSGKDSASALIEVTQWPARFTFSPSMVRFDAKDVRQPLRVLASDSAGVPMVGGTSRVGTCRSLNERVATLVNGEVVSVANGSTWIRCSDRGIADSIRVDVQQRAVQATIANKTLLGRTRTPGDTFRIVATARDRNGKEVTDARPTWASLNPLVVSVDPVNGRARAVGGGDTRIIVQVADVADSISLSVSGPAIQLASGPVIDTAARKRATLSADEMFVYEGETTTVNITVVDSTGVTVSLGSRQVSWRPLDTTVVARLDTARIVGKKFGTSQLIVTYAGLADTAQVNVSSRSNIKFGAEGGSGTSNKPFDPPVAHDSTVQQAAALKAAQERIFTNPNLGAIRQNVVLVANGFGSIAEHFTKTDLGITEDRKGPMFGGVGSLTFYQKFEVAGGVRLGTLAAVDTLSESIEFQEFEGSLAIFPVPQLGIRGSFAHRGEKSELASQTWNIPKIAVISRFSFIGDVFNTYGSFFIMPGTKAFRAKDPVTQKPIPEAASAFSRGGEAGIEFRLSRANGLNGGVTYYIEKLSFDENPRIESLSSIRLRFGFNIGR